MQKIKQNISVKKESNDLLFFAVAEEILKNFPQRAKEIVKKRFGLSSENTETLEKIGHDYNITRERVRQIIADIIRKISQKTEDPVFKKAENRIIFTIEENFGIIKTSELLDKLANGNDKEARAILFLRICSKKILTVEKKGLIKESLTTSKEITSKAEKIRESAKKILEEKGILLSDESLVQKISKIFGKDFSREKIASYLKVSVGIEKNKFGKWGLKEWPEVSPKGTKEKVYSILREKKRPLHFTEIAKIMDEYGLSRKKAHPQTIHNELIKNDKFVLIGRGIYALREWGYSEGTVRDVLEQILKKSNEPMTKDKIISEVLKIRKVKKATVLINLGNRKFFSKEKNLYSLVK
jgi:DNA-directed RNA polymerase delta subunit